MERVAFKNYGNENIKYYCDKQKISILLRKAVKEGKIIKPDRCSECGKRGKIEGHHSDYSKPLYVIWLCVSCHPRYHIHALSNSVYIEKD